MQTRRDLNGLFLFALLAAATGADAQVQPEVAKRYFEEATQLCARDAGRLWGVSLCGPMVIVDQATGTRATSQPEPEGQPPRFSGFADGPVSSGGVRWFSFPLYMLPENDADVRQQVMLHGLFHRIQPELGFMTDDGFNEHLGTLEGRVWMQLEWRALRRAVEPSGDRAEAIADALAFRRERRRRFPGAADNERRDEIREGHASYTGIAASANSSADAHRAAASALAGGESQPSFVGNFEAASGPAYGVLLDDLLPGWRRQVRITSDLGRLARLRHQHASDDGRCRGSGALRRGDAANGGGSARSSAAGRRRRVASTLCRWARADDACRGQRDQRHHRQRRHSGGRYCVFSQFHPFRSLGPSRSQRRRLARCRWVHTVRTGDRTARRDDPAGGGLERHS
jgi:hypothetical protein